MPAPIKFVIDKTNPLAFNKFDFYFAHNIYNYTVFERNQKDSDFEFVEFVDDTYPIQRIGLKTTAITGRKGINYCMTLDTCEFKFKFKGCPAHCIVEKDKETPITIAMEDKIYYKITVWFDTYNYNATDVTPTCVNDNCEEKTSPSELSYYKYIQPTAFTIIYGKEGKLFDGLIKNTISYAEKYMNDCDSDSNKLNIYMNDEGFWERVITRKKRDIDTIYLPKKDKDMIIADINKFLEPETKTRYEMLGRTHKRVYLFEGLPGSGKTSFIAALASMIDYDIATITFTDKVTDGKLMRLIKNIPEKTFLVLEDIDVLFTERKKNDDHKNQVTFSGVLNSLDGITTKDGFICFMTTNYKNMLDTALLRPGRIDKQLEFKHANKEQIQTMFIKFMADSYTPEKFAEFYTKFKELSIDVTMSLIQEYMFKYLDDPDSAITNIDEIKSLHMACVTDKKGELYT